MTKSEEARTATRSASRKAATVAESRQKMTFRRSEHVEQVDLVRWLRSGRVLFCAIPNGARTSMVAAKRLKAEGLTAGAPDLLIFDPPPADPSKKGVALEMKAVDGQKPSPAQLEWQTDLAARGWMTLVCFGAAEAMEALARLGYRLPVANAAHSAVGRFWEKVDRSGGENACWTWTATRNHKGYGSIGWNGRVIGAHRAAWEIQNGIPPPPNMCVLHRCDNPPCVNPSHLFIGTNQDNVDDRERKGRNNTSAMKAALIANPSVIPRGEQSGLAVLSEEQVCEIVLLRTKEKQRDTAARFGVTQALISKIQRRELWSHLDIEGHGPSGNLTKAKTHCKRGHLLSVDNLWPSALRHGRRDCKKCSSERRTNP